MLCTKTFRKTYLIACYNEVIFCLGGVLLMGRFIRRRGVLYWRAGGWTPSSGFSACRLYKPCQWFTCQWRARVAMTLGLFIHNINFSVVDTARRRSIACITVAFVARTEEERAWSESCDRAGRQTAGATENARHENAGPNCRGGNRGKS